MQKKEGFTTQNGLLLAFTLSELALLLSFLTPWFTFNWSETGAYWGAGAWKYVLVQFIFIFWYLTRSWKDKTAGKAKELALTICIELAVVSIPLALAHVFFYWVNPNIMAVSTVEISLHTSMPPFWAACGLSIAAIALFQAYIVCAHKHRNKMGA